MSKVYKITGRSGSIISFVDYNPITGKSGEKVQRMELKGFNYAILRKGVNIIFEGAVKPENLVYDYVVKPTKLVSANEPKPAKEKKGTTAEQAGTSGVVFEVVKRAGTVIHYRMGNDISGRVLQLDLAGYTYRSMRKGIQFQFANDKLEAENIRYWAFRGETNQLPLAVSKVVPPSAKAKTTQRRGATPNTSIFRKHF